jgi:hypothetical protein
MSAQDPSETSTRSGWRVLQLRSLLSNNLTAVAAALIVLALVGGLFTYNTHVDPGTEVQTVQEASWTSTGEYTHQATVTRGTAVFENGTVLRNQPGYIETIAPTLNGTFQYTYDATAGGDVRAEVTTALVLRSVAEEANFEYWREEDLLTTETVEGLQPGDTATVPFSFNVTAVRQRIAAIQEQLGTTLGTTEITVESRVQLTGERNGQQVSQQRNYAMSVTTNEGTYNVDNDAVQHSGQQLGRETRTATYGTLRASIPPAVLVVALLACVVIGVARYRETLALSEVEQSWLSYCQDRSEFDEWISPGELSESSLPDRRVDLATLGGLVDLAIDSNRRVIEDDSRGLCAVLVEDVAYVYERPEKPSGEGDPLLLSGGVASTGAAGDADDMGDTANENRETDDDDETESE